MAALDQSLRGATAELRAAARGAAILEAAICTMRGQLDIAIGSQSEAWGKTATLNAQILLLQGQLAEKDTLPSAGAHPLTICARCDALTYQLRMFVGV